MKALAIISWAAAWFAAALVTGVSADGYVALELYKWNERLRLENWRVFLGSQTTETLGVFLADPLTSDLNGLGTGGSLGSIEALKKCGIEMVELKRNRFTSPFVPNELTISTPESRKLSPTIDKIMRENPTVTTVAIKILQSEWSRMMTNDTTSLLYSSLVWGDPTARAALIKCVKNSLVHPVTESKLTADVEVQFRDNDGRPIRLSTLVGLNANETILNGSTSSDEFTLLTTDVKLARRKGICVTDVIFFRNASGQVGTERCLGQMTR
ncbi:hypothetical protein [Mesorhizobium sp. M1272]|uniref:hypothetical protein n=1 Tax=Mesorhizobium sp. M1272 TaxID=2957074 RepID=UPI003334D527